MKKRKIIAGNWKLYVNSPERARTIFMSMRRAADTHPSVTVIACPPFLYVTELAKLTKGKKRIFVGGQDAHFEDSGAFTGEVGAPAIAASGARYAIVGHSERRAMGESDEIVNKKLKAVIRAGMTAIVCVGERERDEHGRYLSFVKNQIDAALMGVGAPDLARVIIAYEPVWAIGKPEHEAMKPHDLHQMALFIRKTLSSHYGTPAAFSLPILYGGSVSPRTAREHMEAGVDGLLVGRASTDPKEITEIVAAAETVKR